MLLLVVIRTPWDMFTKKKKGTAWDINKTVACMELMLTHD